ncbi:MAG: NAD-dependent epimerase/dehydratase family protein [Clostridia bacterium]|nr:NAD-dependent epimerase/dehydratase family protein [Clostridia bacterium]
MKVLIIGGTGIMSTEVTRLALEKGMEVWQVNRGNHPERIPDAVRLLKGSIDDESIQKELSGQRFDVVMDFVVFKPEQAERDVRLFLGKCGHYLVVTSACIYEKPIRSFPITESARVSSSPWDYAVDKIRCEEVYQKAYRELNFPVTLVRPSHTYCKWALPLALSGRTGGWSVLSRMLKGKPVLMHGDGLTLWTITHARDVAKGMVGLFGNSHAIGEAVHITTDETLSWDDIYASIARVLGVELKLVHVSTEMLCRYFPEEWGHFMGDTAHTAIYDNTKIKRLVPGFAATTSADEGLREAVEYILANPALQKEDPEFDALCDRVVASVEAFGEE